MEPALARDNDQGNAAKPHAEVELAVGEAQAGGDTADGSAGPRTWDKFLMLGATLARMGVGLVTFIVLARFLGPAPYGTLATAIAYTGFLAIVTDFGLAVYTLRMAAMAPAEAAHIVRNAIELKALLALIAAPVGLFVLITVTGPSLVLAYGLAYVGVIAYSMGDLLLSIVRARRRFDIEAKLVVATSVLLMAGVAIVAAITRDITAAAAAFAVTRILYLGIILLVLRRELAVQASPSSRLLQLRTTFQGAKGFATDSILTTLSGQLDVLLFGALLTAHDIGIYQAGARLVQVIIPFAVVLSSVYMPSLASALGSGDNVLFRKISTKLNIELVILGLLCGLAFTFVAPQAARYIYGVKFDSLSILWPGFGAFALLRLTSSSFGIQLAAIGNIRVRIVASIISSFTFLLAAVYAVPVFGLPAASDLLALSGLPSILILGGGLVNSGKWNYTLPICGLIAIAVSILMVCLA